MNPPGNSKLITRIFAVGLRSFLLPTRRALCVEAA